MMNLGWPKSQPLHLKLRENMIQFLAGRYRIGFVILALLIAFPVASHALCQATLQWNANNPDPDGYVLFGREEGQSYDYSDPWWRGGYSFTQCTIDQLDEGKTYYFVVRAYVSDANGDDDFSGDSNEVRFAYSDNSSSLNNNINSGSSSAGSSGGGCFLQSLLDLGD
jgi:hypothetical protein